MMKPIDLSQIKLNRVAWNEDEQRWYFAIADIVQALAHIRYPKDYTKKLRKFDQELAKIWNQLAIPLAITTNGGTQPMMCAHAQGILTIAMHVHSPKLKLFKKWVKSFDFSPSEKTGKIELSKAEIKEFYSILSKPRVWGRKKKLYDIENEKLPITKRMNELELILLLIGEKDILWKKGLRKKLT